LRWDRSKVPGSSDDVPARGRGGVLPPRSTAPEDAPDPVDVPRMEPPPPSLEAMVQSRTRAAKPEAGSGWLLWLLLVLVAAAITVYVRR
jgi:hypothetical protein